MTPLPLLEKGRVGEVLIPSPNPNSIWEGEIKNINRLFVGRVDIKGRIDAYAVDQGIMKYCTGRIKSVTTTAVQIRQLVVLTLTQLSWT